MRLDTTDDKLDVVLIVDLILRGELAVKHNFRGPESIDPDPSPGRSIARHARIDLLRPGVDAAREVMRVAIAVTAEKIGRGLAAHTGMTVKDEQRILRHDRGLTPAG